MDADVSDGAKPSPPAKTAVAEPAPVGWATAAMVQDACPAASVTPEQDWAVAPEPNPRTTVRPGSAVPAVSRAARRAGAPTANRVPPRYVRCVAAPPSAAAGATGEMIPP